MPAAPNSPIPETGEKLTAGRADNCRTPIATSMPHGARNWQAWCKRLGWSYTVNHTDRLASDALVHVHMALTAEGHGPGGRR
jgi:uncharacterized protein (DUF58 family)